MARRKRDRLARGSKCGPLKRSPYGPVSGVVGIISEISPRSQRAFRVMKNLGKLNHSIISIVLCFLALWGCSRRATCTIDIPAGYAAFTLKEFAKQAEVEIVFNAPSMVDVKTNAVEGRMTPDRALEVMLEGTSLLVDRDFETGAYAITIVSFSTVTENISNPALRGINLDRSNTNICFFAISENFF